MFRADAIAFAGAARLQTATSLGEHHPPGNPRVKSVIFTRAARWTRAAEALRTVCHQARKPTGDLGWTPQKAGLPKPRRGSSDMRMARLRAAAAACAPGVEKSRSGAELRNGGGRTSAGATTMDQSAGRAPRAGLVELCVQGRRARHESKDPQIRKLKTLVAAEAQVNLLRQSHRARSSLCL